MARQSKATITRREREWAERVADKASAIKAAMARGEVTFAQVEQRSADYQCGRLLSEDQGIYLEGAACLHIIRNLFVAA